MAANIAKFRNIVSHYYIITHSIMWHLLALTDEYMYLFVTSVRFARYGSV